MKCPKCGFVQEQTDDCIQCGIIISKYLKRRSDAAAPAAARSPAGIREKSKISLFSSRDKERRLYYHTCYQMLHAGFTPREVLRHFLKTYNPSATMPQYRKIDRALLNGEAASMGMLESTDYFPEYHCRLIQAGEETGHPERFYQHLSQIMDNKIRLQHVAWSGLAYPAFLLLCAFFILPLPSLFIADAGLYAYLVKAFTPLLSMVIGGFLVSKIYKFMKSRKTARRVIDRGTFQFPLFRKFYLIQFIHAFHALHMAGVIISDAITLSGSAVDNLYFKERIQELKDSALRGNTISEVINQPDIFPADFIQVVSTGEVSGMLDTSLQKYLDILEENFEHQLKMNVEWFAYGLYVGILMLVAHKIIGSYANYLNVFSSM